MPTFVLILLLGLACTVPVHGGDAQLKDGKPRLWTALGLADPDSWPVEGSRALLTAELCRCLAANGDLAAAISTVGNWHQLG